MNTFVLILEVEGRAWVSVLIVIIAAIPHIIITSLRIISHRLLNSSSSCRHLLLLIATWLLLLILPDVIRAVFRWSHVISGGLWCLSQIWCRVKLLWQLLSVVRLESIVVVQLIESNVLGSVELVVGFGSGVLVGSVASLSAGGSVCQLLGVISSVHVWVVLISTGVALVLIASIVTIGSKVVRMVKIVLLSLIMMMEWVVCLPSSFVLLVPSCLLPWDLIAHALVRLFNIIVPSGHLIVIGIKRLLVQQLGLRQLNARSCIMVCWLGQRSKWIVFPLSLIVLTLDIWCLILKSLIATMYLLSRISLSSKLLLMLLVLILRPSIVIRGRVIAGVRLILNLSVGLSAVHLEQK